MSNLKIYCVTDKIINPLDDQSYSIGWVGKDNPPHNYITCNDKINIFHKEKHYSELTFHYWYWKNLLNFEENSWVGFCQKRRYWIKKESVNKNINLSNYNEHILKSPPIEWGNYESIICNPITVNNVKKIKLLKRGLKSIIKKPSIFFDNNKQSLFLHFDMHHGHGNLQKAVEQIDKEDRDSFFNYLNESTSYNPHIMFITRPLIINEWFNVLFPWLERCEKVFGFDSLKGYDTQRLYAYLAERYLSYWFKKNTRYLDWPWTVL